MVQSQNYTFCTAVLLVKLINICKNTLPYIQTYMTNFASYTEKLLITTVEKFPDISNMNQVNKIKFVKCTN